jgi:hypothetical protein
VFPFELSRDSSFLRDAVGTPRFCFPAYYLLPFLYGLIRRLRAVCNPSKNNQCFQRDTVNSNKALTSIQRGLYDAKIYQHAYRVLCYVICLLLKKELVWPATNVLALVTRRCRIHGRHVLTIFKNYHFLCKYRQVVNGGAMCAGWLSRDAISVFTAD